MRRSCVPSRRAAALAFVASVALMLSACGGDPIAPSPVSTGLAGGVTVKGTLVGLAGGASRGVASIQSSNASVSVRVLESPSTQAPVGPDATFTLSGLASGSFTLVFSRGGVEMGRIRFDDVTPNLELVITIQVHPGGGVSLLDEHRNGAGHEDAELEGRIDAVIAVNAAGDTLFSVAGQAVIARAGVTTIRQGNRTFTVSALVVGLRVHVKGAWLTQASGTSLLASEVKLQGDEGDEDDDGPSPSPSPSASPGVRGCAVSGAEAEAEGVIASLQSDAFVVDQKERTDVLARVTSATRIRKGSKSVAFADLRVGFKVQVEGTSLGAASGLCALAAENVKVE